MIIFALLKASKTMKLKFVIPYSTQWGESLHVVVNYLSQDGSRRTQNLLMQTQDGLLWTLETAATMSRQHPVASITYAYQVEDGDGRVLRREWSGVQRVYYFDSSKNYVFDDQWRDMPLCYHLYSNAYLTTQKVAHGERVEPLRVSLYRKTVLFRVSAPQLQKGQSLALLGSHPMLGNWSPVRYLRMEYIGQRDWLLSVNMDAVGLPLEYKYVVVEDQTNELVAWEEGDNRQISEELADGEVRVLYGGMLRMAEKMWRVAGVAVPVFSLRSEHSFGVGDFGDLRLLVDWAVETGMRLIQLLPVNDTTTDGSWHDSYPYNITSCFALHPHYLDLGQLGTLKSVDKMTVYRRRQQELNALSYCDYEAVDRVKSEFLSDIFSERGTQVLNSQEFKLWFEDNSEWLVPYAEWLSKRQEPSLTYYVQYNLHVQLKAVADYARSKGVVLKGDVPIVVNRDSVETACHSELFNMESSTGAAPDTFSLTGQNWGFPTYRWSNELTKWFQNRFRWMEQYFDAIRIDHILGFFRTWEIPTSALHGQLGHFSPSLPMTIKEISYFGLVFRRDLFTQPFINDRVLDRLFGMHAQYVRDMFLIPKGYGLYYLKPEYDTQCKVAEFFQGRNDESSLWIRDGLLRLLTNVLFVEDSIQHGMYHPRIMAYREPVFEALSGEEKDAYMHIYNNYFYQRHSMFWGAVAMNRLSGILDGCDMLACAEDLGMLPDCVSPVLDALRILTLEIQSLPKQDGFEFAHLDANPYRSVATISTHDMAPLRLWWEDNVERTQRYYVTMLQKEGRAPHHLPAHMAEEIIARHLYCPSMLCILQLQDWLAMDAELRRKQPYEERINVPSDPYNHWQYRMHLTLEQLIAETRYNAKVRTMVQRSRR
jgi:4-alpha-glucanotransferase